MKEHVILNHLDRPIRLLLWEKSYVFAALFGSLLGWSFYNVFSALLLGGLSVYGLKQYHRIFGVGRFAALVYWYFPHQKHLYPNTPPSYIREFIG